MRYQSSPSGLALLLIVLGALFALAGLGGVLATGHPAWRWVVAFGCVVQVAGWRVHYRRIGGAR